jgi:hypothetical protein
LTNRIDGRGAVFLQKKEAMSQAKSQTTRPGLFGEAEDVAIEPTVRGSLPELACRHAIDVGEPAVGIATEIEARNQRQQAVIGAIGNFDRQRGLVKCLDIAADKVAEETAQAALGGVVPAERVELLLKNLEGSQTVVLFGKPRVQVVHISLFGDVKKLTAYTAGL